MYGQQVREVIEHHHDPLAEYIKKPTIYYQLDRLVAEGYLQIRQEVVAAPGPGAAHQDITLRERNVYYITEAGRQYFNSLLRITLSHYAPGLSDVDAALFFLHRVIPADAAALLSERQMLVAGYRTAVIQQLEGLDPTDQAHQLVLEHKLAILDAELHWLEHTIAHLRAQMQTHV